MLFAVVVAALAAAATGAGTDSSPTPAYRVEFRVADLDTQCGEENGFSAKDGTVPQWLRDAESTDKYAGLLEVGAAAAAAAAAGTTPPLAFASALRAALPIGIAEPLCLSNSLRALPLDSFYKRLWPADE